MDKRGEGPTRAGHVHGHGIEAIEVLRHARREVPILGVWRCLFKRTELVLAFILLFFTTVAPIRTIRSIPAIVRSTMPAS
jgi:hypothetical protein